MDCDRCESEREGEARPTETSRVRGRRDRLEYGSPGVRGCRGSPSRQEDGAPMAECGVHRSLNADTFEVLDDGA